MIYRRAFVEGGSFFFTLVTEKRRPIFLSDEAVDVLRASFRTVQQKRPFSLDAVVVLPEHLHCIWTLPDGDSDFATRWAMIKRKVSLACASQYKREDWITPSKRKHRESTIWQRRYWEHQIRDDGDFVRHVDYIHYNPVKHAHCERAALWPYSTFHRHVKQGIYPVDWGTADTRLEEGIFGE